VHAAAKKFHVTAALEARGDARLAPGTWEVKYLHTNGYFAHALPDIADKLIAAAVSADRAQGWGLLQHDVDGSLTGSVNRKSSLLVPLEDMRVRCAEYHRMERGGSLADPGHFDQGSLITVDVMLEQPGDSFQGGAFRTRDLSGPVDAPAFNQGDALVFVSHKAHHVAPVVGGTRRVLVVELWRGPACTCPHRCQRSNGECTLTTASQASQEKQDFEDAYFSAMDLGLVKAAMEALRDDNEAHVGQ
jgi:hypothetical protein